MRVVFYHRPDPDTVARVAVATVGPDGGVILAPAKGQELFQAELADGVPDLRDLTKMGKPKVYFPSDGEKFLRVLPYYYRNAYFWAVLEE